MGILKDAPGLYYDDINPDYGSYQKISLAEIIQSFNATYVGKGKICEDVLINDITFHAIRGLQELSYDTLRSEKDWEIIVPSTLRMVLPDDFINYVKVAWTDSKGIERILYPTSKTSNPKDITEVNTVTGVEGEAEAWGGFDTAGDNVDPTYDNDSQTNANYQTQTSSDLGSVDSDSVDDEIGSLLGGRFGLDPQYTQHNGSFFIDQEQGIMHFSSNVAGKTLVLKYIGDGLGMNGRPATSIDLNSSYVHKFAEEAIYKHILYGCLLARKDTPGGLLGQLKRERFAETRKAKIRLSNYKLEELSQVLRGSSKQIKH